jgi:hypothetical protein
MNATTTEIDQAALFTQLICSAINLDYAARALQESRAFGGNAKRRLNLLTNASDSFVAAAIDKFDMADGTGVNTLSTVITEHQRMLLKCNPQQIQASLEHVAWMVQTGTTPTPLPPIFKRKARRTTSIC